MNKCFMWFIWTLGNQDEPMIALLLQSAPKKDFTIAKVRESTAGGQMPRLSKEFESVNKAFYLHKTGRLVLVQGVHDLRR